MNPDRLLNDDSGNMVYFHRLFFSASSAPQRAKILTPRTPSTFHWIGMKLPPYQ